MSVREPEITFRQLLRLFRHLRKGGTRRGACGWADVTQQELESRLALDMKFAEALERWEYRSLARDELRLDSRVCDGDRVALMFRIRRIDSQVKGMKKGRTVRKEYEKNREYAQIEKEIVSLAPEERRKLAAAYRQAGV